MMRHAWLIGLLGLASTSTTHAERKITGLDLNILLGGGAPFGMGGGILVDARPLPRLQLEASTFIGASIGVKELGKLGPPATLSGGGFLRFSPFVWESQHRPFTCVERTATGCWGTLDAPMPELNTLSLEVGAYYGALPFRFGTRLASDGFAERAVAVSYVLYPSFGVRWDSYDQQGTLLVERATLGARVYHGPLLAPRSGAPGEAVAWGSPAAFSPNLFDGPSWGATFLCGIVMARYLTTSVELGGGAVSTTIWVRVWLGASIPVL